jgi:hypothetical protein
VKLKAISLLACAIIASSFSAPTRYGAGNPADAADAIRAAPQAAVTIPEFVPIVNFSEFVLATEQFASENRVSARDAAEALSAKFAVASASAPQQMESPHAPPQQTVSVAGRAPSIAIPDPNERPLEQPADPAKVASAEPEQKARPVPAHLPALAAAPARPKRVQRKKFVSASEPRPRRPLRKAMGLGMTVDSAENMPRPSSFTGSTKTVYSWNGSGWSASGKERDRSRR